MGRWDENIIYIMAVQLRIQVDQILKPLLASPHLIHKGQHAFFHGFGVCEIYEGKLLYLSLLVRA